MATKVCSRCIYDSDVPSIKFDEDGVCSYCKQVDDLQNLYGTGTSAGEEKLSQIIEQIKKEGRRKKYDCVVGVSGGTDSSYMLSKALEWGLRPLAAHYDNTWNTAIATENIRKVTSKLGVDLFTIVVDNKESEDIFKSFFLAGVPELDCSTDIALAETLYRAASKYGVKYILEGHSFVTEGVSPIGKNYFDGKYIKSIHKEYGKMRMKTFPNMNFASFMKWVLVKKIKKIRPLWYIDYSKEDAREFLQKEFDWQYYGGHHLENRLTAFLHTVYNPRKFSIDNRNWSLSASARSGLMDREEALSIYNSPIKDDPELIEYFQKRLGLSPEEYEEIMSGQQRSFRDFKTYKERFEMLRPMFKVLADNDLVPRSFYLKYCHPIPK